MRFCSAGTGGVADLDREVAARDHDAVGSREDVLERRATDRLGALDLRDQRAPAAGGAHQLARHVHVAPLFGKDTGQEVGLDAPPPCGCPPCPSR